MLVNLGASLARSGKSVLLLDAGLGAKGVSDYLNVTPESTLMQVATGGRTLQSAISHTTQGFAFSVLATVAGRQAIASHRKMARRLETTVEILAEKFDVLIVDAVLDENDTLPLSLLSDGTVIVQVSDTAESIKSAYSIVKRLNAALGRRPFSILLTGTDEVRAKVVFENLEKVASRYLAVPLTSIGFVPDDDHIYRAARLGRSVIDAFPRAGASLAFHRIADSFVCKVGDASNSLAMATGS